MTKEEMIGPDRAWKDLTLELIDEKYADVPLWYITKCWDILMSEYPDLLECEYEHVMAFDEQLKNSQGDLFGGLTQQDFDAMIEREIRNIVANLQQRYGKAEVFIGIAK